MKNTTSLKCVILLLLISFNFQTSFSQDKIRGNMLSSYTKMHTLDKNVAVESPILKDGKYTYQFKEKEILVEIKNGYYYEYLPEKEYIKAVINWDSEYKYKLVIVDIEKKGTPLKIGSELTAQITEIKGNQYFYTSLLNNKTLSGSFTKMK